MSLAFLSAAIAGRARRVSTPADMLVARFAPECRAAVARTIARDPRLADLARSFPALLHRIAMRRGEPAAELVLAGAPLRDAAARAGLPLWTRRLPPETFGLATPDLPDGVAFRRRIANCLPATRKSARGWLERVAEAARWGESDFVLWVARETARLPARIDPGLIPILALHAFYSARPDTHGGAMVEERWSPGLKSREALRRADEWLDTVQLAVTFGDRAIDPLCVAASVDGYEFAPVLSATALLEEAKAFDNCLRLYGGPIVDDDERVWVIRKDGVRVAALCLEYGEAPFPQISELKGRANTPAPAEVWHAARRWLDGQQVLVPAVRHPKRALDRTLWASIWKPYWLARPGAMSDLPLAPSARAIYALRRPRRRHRPRRRA